MSNLIIYILIYAIYTNILFYNNANGLNWLLTTIPLYIFQTIILLKNNKVVDKKGFLFGIPIMILAISNLLYNNVFTKFNILAIPILFICMYVYTIRPTFNLRELLLDMVRLVFKKFYITHITNFFNITKYKIDNTIKLTKEAKKKIVSFLIVIPIVILILILLATADIQFKNMFNFITDIFEDLNFFELLFRIFIIGINFVLMGSLLNYLLFKYGKEEYPKDSSMKIEPYTIKLLLIVLNAIYLIFDIIQIRSLFLHHVGDGIIYSEYARTGFFQLMFVSFINLGILLISKKSEESNMIKHLSSLLVFFTIIIICSSFYRMYLYDMAYGYTILRLLVYTSLITESILLIPTLFYIYNSKVQILKYYMIICLSVYTIMNIYSIDKVIAKNNIKRYDRTNKIDIEYLVNLSYDDIPELYNFYTNVEDKDVKREIQTRVCGKYYYREVYSFDLEDIRKDRNILEYNISRDKAFKTIESFDCKNIDWKKYNKTYLTAMKCQLDEKVYRYHIFLEENGEYSLEMQDNDEIDLSKIDYSGEEEMKKSIEDYYKEKGGQCP